MIKDYFRRMSSIKDIAACALLSLGQSLYFFLILAYLLSLTGFYTLKTNIAFTWYYGNAYKYAPSSVYLYRIFITIFLITFLLDFLRWKPGRPYKTILLLLGMEIFWIVLFSCIDLGMLQGNMKVSWMFMNALIVISIPIKWFWYKLLNDRPLTWTFPRLTGAHRYKTILTDIVAIITIFVVIYVPHPDSLVARQLMMAGSSQNTGFVMAPGFAYLQGLLPYVDVQSVYGLGLPVILSRLAQWFGGFDYVHMSQLVIGLIILYFILFYQWIKMVLRDPLLALGGVLLMVNLTVFGREGGPVSFFDLYSATPVRIWWDIIMFFCLYWHLRSKRPFYLYLAAIITGLQMFYVTSSGMCLLGAFLTYALLLWDIKTFLLLALTVMASFFILVFSVVHWHMFTSSFWGNLFGLMHLMSNGYGYTTYAGFFSNGLYLTVVSIMIPVFFLLSAVIGATVSLTTYQLKKRWVFIAVLGVYGLLSFHHFFIIAAANVIFRDAVILVSLACLWGQWLLRRYWHRQLAVWSLLLICAISLLTNPHYNDWPNMLNRLTDPVIKPPVKEGYYINYDDINYPERGKLSYNSLGLKQEDMKTDTDFSSDREFLDYFHHEFDFSKDADLIRSLTSPHERVALISSYELPILMQAERKPFLYTFPLISSRSMRVRALAPAYIITEDNLKRTIQQFEKEKPRYVFLQKVYGNPEVIQVLSMHTPGPFYCEYEDILQVLYYVLHHYQPYKNGYYLMALKRVS